MGVIMINKVKELIAEVLENDVLKPEHMEDTANIVEDIGLDSLQLINLMLRAEDEFGIEIDFDNLDMKHLESVQAFCDYIVSCKEGLQV